MEVQFPEVKNAFAFIKYWGNAYEPYDFTLNTFLFFFILGDFIYKMLGGPEIILWWSGMKGVTWTSWPSYFFAKWCNELAWNLSYQYAWLYNKDSSVIAATLQWIFVSPWVMLFVLIPDFIEVRDFNKLMADGNYQLTLLDGIVFHYFQYSEIYGLWPVMVQTFWDMVMGNPFTWIPLIWELPMLIGYWLSSYILFFSTYYLFVPAEVLELSQPT